MNTDTIFWTKFVLKDIYGVLIAITILFIIGVIAIVDFTPAQFHLNYCYGITDPAMYLLKRVFGYFLTGLFVMFCVIKFRDRIDQLSSLMGLLSIILLLLPFIPALGEITGGTKRNIILFDLRIYTGYWSVLMALPFLGTTIHSISVKDKSTFKRKLMTLPFLTTNIYAISTKDMSAFKMRLLNMWIVIMNLCFMFQPDASILLLFDLIILILVATSSLTNKEKITISFFTIGVPLIFIIKIIFFDHYQWQLNRLLSVYNWQDNRETFGYQTWLALLDFKAGGLWGSGFGSYQAEHPFKYIKWMTISHYILQITGKQFGLVGLLCVINLYFLITLNRIKHIAGSKNLIDRSIKVGALSFIMLQAMFNIIRTTNLVPFVGYYTPPFIGFGFHSMVSSFFALGLLFSNKN